VKIRDTVVHSGYNFILWIQFCILDITVCSKVTGHAKDVTIKTKGLLTANAMQVSRCRTQMNHAIQTTVRNFTCIPIESQPGTYVVSSRFLFSDCTVLLQLLQT